MKPEQSVQKHKPLVGYRWSVPAGLGSKSFLKLQFHVSNSPQSEKAETMERTMETVVNTQFCFGFITRTTCRHVAVLPYSAKIVCCN